MNVYMSAGFGADGRLLSFDAHHLSSHMNPLKVLSGMALPIARRRVKTRSRHEER
jgi:hypothetical protein